VVSGEWREKEKDNRETRRKRREEGCGEGLRELSASEGGRYNGKERWAGISFGHFLEFEVAEDYFQAGAGAEAFG